MKCFHGCGQQATFFAPALSRREKSEVWVCAKRAAQCPQKMEQIKQKRLETLAKVDGDGIDGFTRNALAVARARRQEDGTFTGAKKTAQTKRATIDGEGRDLFQLAAINAAITRFGQYAGLSGKPEFEVYRYHVARETAKQPLHTLKNFKKRAGYGRSKDPYQVDHRYSVVQGFLDGISPEIIGHISNLQMLPSRENNSKGSRCSQTKEALIEGFLKSTSA